MMNDGNEYTTTDFYTIAMLLSQGYDILKISEEGSSRKIKRFHFFNSEALQKSKLDFINSRLMGNLKEFKNAIESVKDIIYSSKPR